MAVAWLNFDIQRTTAHAIANSSGLQPADPFFQNECTSPTIKSYIKFTPEEFNSIQ
jgi:hypothetical protein